jgi:hypothetical protein
MIQFNCHCSHRFSVTEDQAGGTIQCPSCRKLNDIPFLEDLSRLEDDGTIKLDDGPVPTFEKDFVQKNARLYSRELRNKDGAERDMRPTVEEFMRFGLKPDESVIDRRKADAPQYDPVTGELIDPVTIKPDPEADAKMAIAAGAVLPMAQPTLNYAQVPVVSRGFSLARVPLEMFRPVNVLVWSLVALVFAFNLFASQLSISGVLWTVFFALPMMLVFVGHYGVVLDSIALRDADDLPAPLRNLSFSEDIWRPFMQVQIASMVAALPLAAIAAYYGLNAAWLWLVPWAGLFVAWASYVPQPVWIGGMAFFSLLFPALALVTVTSGALNNLTPARVLGTIRRCGMGYLLAAAMCWGGFELLMYGSAMTFNAGGRVSALMMSTGAVRPTPTVLPWMTPAVENLACAPVLLVAWYLLHASAWTTGLLYRKHHEEFPWVLQRHISTRKDTLKQLEEMRSQANASRTAGGAAPPLPERPSTPRPTGRRAQQRPTPPQPTPNRAQA